ncbi:phosphotransferase [Bacillus sp. FJAT-49732]|uniref:Phosphotransferase n=1 Tax=Lederbergia citrisecunda TaxID=2833583 RepID=A0A942YLA7_9BACI|nr:phosphotransferase [Lederbergia citrisecunda]MBS4200149.1 phosphotransferase [Lederbergia citrisecunda]
MDDMIVNGNSAIDQRIAALNNHKLLGFKIVEWKELSGGTSSKIWKLTGDDDKTYVYKENEKDVIIEESLYLKAYEHLKILPEIIFIDENQQYYIYEYIEGEIKTNLGNKEANLHILVEELIIHYQPFPEKKWGYTYQRYDSFREFLLSEVDNARDTVETVLTFQDCEKVKFLIETRDRGEDPYLLHGDCGVHNFLQKNDRLIGVIDPLTLAGPPLFELVFAFCSSPDHLSYEVIYEVARKLPTFNHDRKYLVEEVIIGLYLRIERCLYHHPNDLPDYLKAWSYWISLLDVDNKNANDGI